MTSVEFVWSKSGSDEAFLADMKAAMKSIDHLETVKILYDIPTHTCRPHEILGDGAAPWLKFLDENVMSEHSATIRKIVFDVPFKTKLRGSDVWYEFDTYGNSNDRFSHLLGTIKALSKNNDNGVVVTVCGVNMTDMKFISTKYNTNPVPETTPTSNNKPEAKIAGHKRHPETMEIVAVEGVSNGAWTHFDVAETSHFELAKTSYSISVPVPEGLAFDDIRVAVDANGKSVKIGNVPKKRWDSPPPKIRMDCSFFIPNDALVSTIRARKADGKVVVCMDRGKSAVMPDEGIADERVVPIE
jgi:hypothetical protein